MNADDYAETAEIREYSRALAQNIKYVESPTSTPVYKPVDFQTVKDVINMDKTFLGDGVYVESRYEYGEMVLTLTERDLGHSNTIVLGPAVFRELIKYIETVKR